jgi:hypothetical protein
MDIKEIGWVWTGSIWLIPVVDFYEDDSETSDSIKHEGSFGLCEEICFLTRTLLLGVVIIIMLWWCCC